MRIRRAFASALVATSLVACGQTDPVDDVGAGGMDVMPTACDETVPVVTYETFGEGFLSTYCQGCHASAAADRQGAPDALVFDTEDDVYDFQDQILDAVTSDEPRMPPSGGPLEDDRERLTIWLSCFAE